MLDPFPFAAPPILAKLAQPFADYFSLTTLPLHLHEVLFAFTIYSIVNNYIAPAVSTRLFPTIYPHFNSRTKLNWDVHVVSLVQSCLINTMALWVMWYDKERADMNWKEKVWGYTGASGLIQGFATGYFVWDLCITTVNVKIFGLGMLAHAVSALFVFSLGFRPFLNFYGPTFILYELSSPFLNIHWFCDKLNMTGSKIQLYNGMALLFTFFSCRLIWGSYQSFYVFGDVYRAIASGGMFTHDTEAGTTARAPSYDAQSEIMRFAANRRVPVWLAISYLGANITLNSLNWFWFAKMIETVRKRFDPPLGTKRPDKKLEKEHTMVEGVDVETDADVDAEMVPIKVTGMDGVKLSRSIHANGRKIVEVEKKEVRSRRRG
ncbi:DUF887-domain-containing protein [Lepidopterella palustris CBS 459.81]|uniref:DUF887-domain-containing protein n=1 Tax=Lepidopterella palustris CBS 459.81 TaxID=1314670 RepID=A0A8E2JD09_9PEZI|nr:DUF887-domain-containing protein [Lepidopterella palustris CBS 459.81]